MAAIFFGIRRRLSPSGRWNLWQCAARRQLDEACNQQRADIQCWPLAAVTSSPFFLMHLASTIYDGQRPLSMFRR